ncbi:MAG: alpha/beta hydrolase [Lachnospiraceae bacterium]|nr:alpha/beta hydrolase [Lachnospiraceae bacterium]
MNIHEFGDKNNPVILLLPGTICYWKSNFEKVCDTLAKNYLVAIVSYTGFEETDSKNYTSVNDELNEIESYIIKNYDGKILAAYGCSLGGTFVAHLCERHNISMKYGIIGSSDMDKAGNILATIMAFIVVKIVYPFVKTGKFKPDFMQKKLEKEMQLYNPYKREFVALTGCMEYDMSFVTKESIRNQFKSDLVTPLNTQIDNGETKIHVFYAKNMGAKYLTRYKKFFKSPTIHELDGEHEEFLCVTPDKWCDLIKDICEGKC